MRPHELIDTAQTLIEADTTRPKRANLRRAVSAAYYAMFHCLARSCADIFIGKSGQKNNTFAWLQVYRALRHGAVVEARKNKMMNEFPQSVKDFAEVFVNMQKKRHLADYSPTAIFSKSEVEESIKNVKAVIKKYNSAKIENRRAFAAFILFKSRRD